MGPPNRGWLRIGAQLGQALVVMAVVVMVAFLLVRLVPGDPARSILGPQGSEEAVAALREELGTDRPFGEQFTEYAGGLLRGDLGESIAQSGRSVTAIIGSALPVSLSLVIAAIAISTLVGVPLGLWAALASHRSADHAVRGLATLLLSTPTFFLGLVLLLVFSIALGLLPGGGWGDGWPDNVRYLVLPSLALAGYLTPLVVRTVRQAALDASGQLFVEAAVARGIRPRLVTFGHVLPNCLLPVVTLLGINFGALIGGSVVVEAVFALPGLGTEIVRAVAARDYPVIQGVAIVSALCVVGSNLLTDAIYVLVDPRTRRA